MPEHTNSILEIGWELYASLVETLEVMSDAELMAAFRQGAQELADGKGRLWEDVKRDLVL
jgi:hypothetical protein